MPRLTRLLLALLLALPALVLPSPEPVQARTRIVYDGEFAIEIQLPITLSLTEAENAPRPDPKTGQPVEPATYFERDIDGFWLPLQQFRYKTCYQISLEATVDPEYGEAPGGYHTVGFDPSSLYDTSWVDVEGKDPFIAGGKKDTPKDLTTLGVWGWEPVHHLIGAYLGLGTAPIRTIDQALVDRLGQVVEAQLQKQGQRLDKPCVKAVQSSEWHFEHQSYAITKQTELEAWLEPDAQGNLTGEATYSYRWSGWTLHNAADPCYPRSEFSSEGRVEGLPVTGHRERSLERDVVTVELAPFEAAWVQESTCPAGVAEGTDTITLWPEVPWAGELVDGRFEETVTLGDAATAVIHTVIEQTFPEEAVG